MKLTVTQFLRQAEDGLYAKFVRTKSGYHLTNAHSGLSHINLVPKGETALSAGFVYSGNGKKFRLCRDWSSTLKMWPADEDLAGLEKHFGIPGEREE